MSRRRASLPGPTSCSAPSARHQSRLRRGRSSEAKPAASRAGGLAPEVGATSPPSEAAKRSERPGPARREDHGLRHGRRAARPRAHPADAAARARLAVDRGRIVREAIHLALEDVGRDGAESALVRRLREHVTSALDRRGRTGFDEPPRRWVRRPPRQLRGPVRPAAAADLQAQAGHHRGRAVAGHRRVHRPHQGDGRRRGSSTQTTQFLVVAATLLDLKIVRLLPSAEIEDEEDLALLEARDLLFARLMQYRAFKQVAAVFEPRMAEESRRVPAVGGARRAVRGRAARRADHARPGRVRQARRPRPSRRRPSRSLGLAHLHAPQVSVREQAAIDRRAAAAHPAP